MYREKLLEFLLQMKQDDGSFRMHEDGEVDIRGTYCALNVATLLNLKHPNLTNKAAEFVRSCQTYEGGLGPFPGVEGHGGYTFCGLAALGLLGKVEILDIPKLIV